MNEQLRLGRYFFIDIARDGIALFESEGFPFAEPLPLTPAQALEETRRHFEEWHGSSTQFYRHFGYALRDHANNIATFQLHQAAERAYQCLLLVRTLYSPLCRARHNGDYAARRTMPMPGSFHPADRRLEELRAA